MGAFTTSVTGSPKLSVTVESSMERTETSLKAVGVGELWSLVTELSIFSIIAEMKLVEGGLDRLGMDDGGAAGIMQSVLGYVREGKDLLWNILVRNLLEDFRC